MSLKVPRRAVKNPQEPGSASELLRFFEELAEQADAPTDLSTLEQRVELLRSTLADEPAGLYEARARALANEARIREMTFLSYP